MAWAADDQPFAAGVDDSGFHGVESVVPCAFKVRDRFDMAWKWTIQKVLPLLKGSDRLNVEDMKLHAGPVGVLALDRRNQLVEGAAPHPKLAVEADVGE
jgi:hypothetical protein